MCCEEIKGSSIERTEDLKAHRGIFMRVSREGFETWA